MKKIFILAAALCGLALASCKKQGQDSSKASEEAENESKLTIGFSIDTLAIERWRRDCDIFLNTAKDLGADVIVQNSGNSVEVQNEQIEYLIKRGVKAIVIVPKDAESLGESVRLARSKNIPVISYDRLLRNSAIDLYVTIDSQAVGTLMANELLRLKPRGSWFCIYGPEEDFNMTLIRRGVEGVLKNSKAKIVFNYWTDGWNYDLSYRKMADLLKAGKVPDAVVAGNDALADSIIRAIGEFAADKDIAVGGQDADIAGCQNVVTGKQAVTIYKPITELASKTAEIAVAMAKGKSAEDFSFINGSIDNGSGEIPVLWLHPTAVTAQNMDEIVIKSGFHTRQEVYRE
ncbi:MAG: substrate-binding domain-containing protein [Treponema sp.]|nr:substrate-binding domain-containing protein [Treponema sp.]